MAETSIRFKVETRDANRKVAQLERQVRKLEVAVKAAGGTTGKSTRGFKAFGQGAQAAGVSAKALGVAVKGILGPLSLVAGTLGAVVGGFKGFVEADKARAAVKTLGVDAQTLESQLVGVVARTKGLASTNQLLAASYDVASAGFSKAADITKILEASVLGAVGGMTDIATVSDAATSVMNAYGLSTDKVSKIVDGFIQTQNDGKIVVGQYASQIGRVAPIAAAAGVGLDELNAAISTVTAQGVPVESTFAGIGQVVASILKPTSEAATRAKELGLEFNTAAIKSKGFAGFLQDVIDKTGGSEVEITKLFGSVDALKALMPLISGDLKTFNKNLLNQKNATGAAGDAADIMGETVSSQISRIVNSITTLVRGLDQVLGPAIKGVLDLINNVITAAVTATAKLSEFFQRQRAQRQAREEAGASIGRGTFKGDPEAIAARAEEIYQQSQISSQPQTTEPLPVNTELQNLLTQLQNQLNAGGDSGQAEAQLKRQMEAAQSLSTEFQRQIELTNELDDAKDRILQRDFEIADLNAKFPDLKDEEIEKLEELIHKLHDAKEGEIARTEAANDAAKAAEAARKAQEADPLFQMQQQLEELLKIQNQVAAGATSIGNAFADAFGDVVTGAKTGQEALADMLKSIASDFLAMAKKIIAQQLAMILYGTIMKALGIGGGFNSPAASPGGSAGVAGIGGGGLGDVFGNTSSFGTFADGGFVNKPTNALIGEGGESEYVVPASKMSEAMGRYARGARGAAVIPDGSGGDAGGEMGGGGGSIDVSYSVERINNVNYVTAAEFEKGMAQAAKRGAELGKRGVYSDLINKRSVRSRVGV